MADLPLIFDNCDNLEKHENTAFAEAIVLWELQPPPLHKHIAPCLGQRKIRRKGPFWVNESTFVSVQVLVMYPTCTLSWEALP